MDINLWPKLNNCEKFRFENLLENYIVSFLFFDVIRYEIIENNKETIKISKKAFFSCIALSILSRLLYQDRTALMLWVTFSKSFKWISCLTLWTFLFYIFCIGLNTLHRHFLWLRYHTSSDHGVLQLSAPLKSIFS